MKMAHAGTAALLVVASALLAACGSCSAQSETNEASWWVEGCSALDWSGEYEPKTIMALYYDASEGEVVATQDASALPTRFFTAHPDMPYAFIGTRNGPVQIVNGVINGLPETVSLCLHPPGVYAMTCVDNDDIGTFTVTPTAIGDDCTVLAYNQFYTEPGSQCTHMPSYNRLRHVGTRLRAPYAVASTAAVSEALPALAYATRRALGAH